MGKKKEVKQEEGGAAPSSKKQKQQEEPDIDDIVEEKEEVVNEEDIDETYSDLDDDELLALALKDDEEEEDEADFKKKAEDEGAKRKKKKKAFSRSNVLYIGHVPHGFFEEQMKEFLSQFGKVLQVRVSRSKKTGKSRGYAFVQFLNKEVADIVQKTMHGYILTGRSLVCQHVPEEHVHEKMFLGGLAGKNSKVNTYPDARKKRVLAHAEQSKTEEGIKRRVSRLKKADKRRKELLTKKGINYSFAGGYEEQK